MQEDYEDEDIASISVSAELAEHYQIVKDYRDSMCGSQLVKPSDQVAALNAVTSILKDLAKIQESVYSSEQIARLQIAIVNALKEADSDLQERVLRSMEVNLCH